MTADEMTAAVARVEVLDLAGAIIANPKRAMCSEAGKIALALAVERFWEVCLEADVLVHALEMAMPWAETNDGGEQAERVALQAAHVRNLMNALTGRTPKETSNGKSES